MHKHLPWGFIEGQGFATADETAYPRGLCIAIAEAVVKWAHSRNHLNVGLLYNPDTNTATTGQLVRMSGAAQRSGTGRRPAPLVSEFQSVQRLQAEVALGANAKKIRTCSEQGVSGCKFIMAGIFREPESFIKEALAAKHPVDLDTAVPGVFRSNAKWILEQGPSRVARFRLNAIRDLAKLVHDNCAADKAILDVLSPSQQKVLAGRKLHTLNMLAQRIGHADKTIVQEASVGFHITGLQPFTHYFEERIVMPTITEAQLKQTARLQNEMLLRKVSSAGNRQIDDELWRITLKEVSEGWLEGPFYKLADVQTFLGQDLVLSRRFPLQQKKVRPIDDLNESNVNLAFGCCDKIDFHDVDANAAAINFLMRVFARGDGTLASPEWTQEGRTIVGRTLDLAHAYKQWALHADAAWAAVAVIWDPVTSRPAICPQATLPFGSSAAVLHFNRLSRLAWEILSVVLKLMVLNFYDDYPMYEPQTGSGMARTAAEVLFRLIGWQVSLEEGKAFNFAQAFISLGVIFKLESFMKGMSFVANKPERVLLICDTIRTVIRKRKMSRSERESLRGKLQYLERHIYGRAGKMIMKAIDDLRGDGSGDLVLGKDDVGLFSLVISWLETSQPRGVAPTDRRPPLLIFTDGAEEYEKTPPLISCGGLMLDPIDGAREYFAEMIPDSLLAEWKQDGLTKVIAQVELLPVLISKRLWKQRSAARRVLFFIDNEVAKFACVTMCSDSKFTRSILQAVVAEELSSQTWTWYSRVPSYSNPADDASRMRCAETEAKFAAKRIRAELPTHLLCT